MIILANVIDQILGLNGTVAYATVLFYIANEGLSIMENLAAVGVDVPPGLSKKLSSISEDNKSVTQEMREEFSDKERR